MNARSGGDSRCCKPASNPYIWHWDHDETHPGVMELQNWMNRLPFFERENQAGILDDLFEGASRGEIVETGDETTPIKPIRRNPDLYELRRTALSKALRFYHAEPSCRPDDLIGLHRHIKHGGKSQQKQIEFATDRYLELRRSW